MKKFKIKTKFRKSSQKQFDQFGQYFPYSCVDIILPQEDSILLTKRTIPPYKGKWHLPGGIIRKNEKMVNAVKRIAKMELNIGIKIDKFLGTYENLNHFRHDITQCFICSIQNGNIESDFQSSQVKFFKILPKNIIPYHAGIIHDARGYLKSL